MQRFYSLQVVVVVAQETLGLTQEGPTAALEAVAAE